MAPIQLDETGQPILQDPTQAPVQLDQNGQAVATPMFNYADEAAKVQQMRDLAKAYYDTKNPEGKMVGQFYVAPSGAEYLANGLKQMMGAYADSKATAKTDELNTQKNQMLADAMTQMNDPKSTQENRLTNYIKMAAGGYPEVGKAIFDSTGKPQVTTVVKEGYLVKTDRDGNTTYERLPEASANTLAKTQSAEGIAKNKNENALTLADLKEHREQAKRDTEQAIKVQQDNSKFETAKQEKLRQYDTGLQNLLQAESMLGGNPTHSGFGKGVDDALGFAGITTDGAKQAAALKPIANAILMNVPRFEGPQSDKDTAIYREAAGKLGDETVPIETRKAALQTVRDVIQRNRDSVSATVPPVNAGINATPTATSTQPPATSGRYTPEQIAAAKAALAARK